MTYDERDLLKRLRAGERDAFEAVVDQHYAAVFRRLCCLCVDSGRAADLTQETFVAAWKSLRTFRGESSLRGWLYGIAHRLWRRSPATRFSPADDDTLFDALPDDGPALEEIVGASADGERLLRALHRLSDLYRAVVVLSYLDDLPHAAIAAQLGIPVGTVKSRLHAALRRLRQLLPEEELIPR